MITPRGTDAGRMSGLNAYAVDVTHAVRARQVVQAEAVEAERRYARAREVIATPQLALLPSGLPVLSATEIAASYLLADADTAADGHRSDACPLPDRQIALVVGDVVGHGVTAALVVGQLRAVLHAGHPPPLVLPVPGEPRYRAAGPAVQREAVRRL